MGFHKKSADDTYTNDDRYKPGPERLVLFPFYLLLCLALYPPLGQVIVVLLLRLVALHFRLRNSAMQPGRLRYTLAFTEKSGHLKTLPSSPTSVAGTHTVSSGAAQLDLSYGSVDNLRLDERGKCLLSLLQGRFRRA